MAKDDIEDLLDKPLMIFGRDVRKIPCFRNSLLYGVGCGLAGGIIVFMFTSKPRLGSHSAVGIFGCVTMSYFMVCRHDWAEKKYNIGQILGARRPQSHNLSPQENNKETTDITKLWAD